MESVFHFQEDFSPYETRLREYLACRGEQLAPTHSRDYKPGISNKKMQVRRLPYSIRRIHGPNIATLPALSLPVGLQDRVPPSPAKPDGADLVRAGYHAHGVHEAVDQGPSDTFTVLGEPWT